MIRDDDDDDDDEELSTCLLRFDSNALRLRLLLLNLDEECGKDVLADVNR